MRKVCNVCGEEKPHTEYSKHVSCADGLRPTCKTCRVTESRLWGQTKTGLLKKMYNTQVASSKRRGMALPSYTKREFIEWAMSQTAFHEMFNMWKINGYKKEDIPSADRTNDYISYSFDNISLMTFRENHAKFMTDVLEGRNNKLSTGVTKHLPNSQDIEYYSMSEAARVEGVTHTTIALWCKLDIPNPHGDVWTKTDK